MKIAVIIPDGAADLPHAAYGGKTALAAAALPHFDQLARDGQTGLAVTVPPGMPPGSDVANLAIMGYNPANCYTGRAPLEAAARGLALQAGQVVFRANLVTIIDGKMVDFAGGHPTNEEAAALLAYLREKMQITGVNLQTGISYRHLCVFDNLADNIPSTTPPHDILNQATAAHLPQAAILQTVMQASAEYLTAWPGNQARQAAGKMPITGLWLWGGGTAPALPPLGVNGAMISAVDLLMGLGVLAGLKPLAVPGATGYYDTDYAAKGRAAVAALKEHDLVVAHIEAPDEASHNGAAAEKIKALERIDQHIVAPLLAEAAAGRARLLCLPDHPTPLATRTHAATAVPYAVYGPGVAPDAANAFSESAVSARTVAAWQLLPNLLRAKAQPLAAEGLWCGE